MNENQKETTRGVSVAKPALSMGAALAIAISWHANQSILWATLHGALSWGYVIYYAVVS